MNKLGGVPGEILEEGGSTGALISGASDKKQTEEVVKGIYAPSGSESQEHIDEEKEKAEIRQKLQKLHDETYYNPTFNPPKNQEEKPLEKVEREKQEEMQDLQKKEEEKPPPLVQRAQQKTERFPGTSG
ncbi:MAG: hypothetical protein Q7S38_00460 [bacterium]|nr:hypothetical protein [bacterium]